MKIFKRVTTAIISLSIIFGNIVPCYAETGVDAISSYLNLYNQIQSDLDENNPIQGNALRQFVDYNYKYGMGFLVDYNENVLSDILSALRGYSSGGHDFTLPENATDEEVIDSASEYLTNNISVSDNSITYNDNSRNMLLYLANEYTKNNQEYIYTIDIKEHPEVIPSTAVYFELAKKMNALTHVNNMSIFCVRINGGICQYAQIPYSNYPYAFCKSYTINNGWDGSAWSCGFIKDGYDNTNILGSRQSTEHKVSCMTWSNTEFVENSITWGGGYSFYGLKNPDNYVAPYGNDKYLLLSYGQTQAIRFLTTDATAQDILYQKYYYNDTVWNDFSTSSGDYTVNSSNVNTVSYGDTTSYIDSFNTENGYPPSPTEININIENEDTENKTPSGGGDNGDDNGGGGSGGSGDSSDSNIFDFLSDIGAVLGNLIKNLGNVLTELISGIADIISGLFEAIPAVFGDFMGGLLGWLPEELRALIILGISAMIIVGIIKIIRG